MSLRAQSPIVNIPSPGPGTGRDHRPPAPLSPGPAVRRHEDQEIMSNVGIKLWRERRNEYSALSAVISCESSLSHLHTHPCIQIMAGHQYFLCIRDSQLS